MDNEGSWEDEDCDDSNPIITQQNEAQPENPPIISSVVRAVSLLLLLWQACYSIPGTAVSVLLKFFKKLFSVLANLSESQVLHSIAKAFPTSLLTL